MTAAAKRRLRMGIKYAIYALAVLLLQDTLLSRLPIAGVHLMLVPVAASCASMWLGAEKGGDEEQIEALKSEIAIWEEVMACLSR